MSKEKKCSYNFNGERVTANTDEACAKLKARYDKIVAKGKKQIDSLKSNSLLANRKRKDTPKPKKKKKTKLEQIIEAKLKKRKEKKAQKRMLDSIRGQKRRGFDGKWN